MLALEATRRTFHEPVSPREQRSALVFPVVLQGLLVSVAQQLLDQATVRQVTEGDSAMPLSELNRPVIAVERLPVCSAEVVPGPHSPMVQHST